MKSIRNILPIIVLCVAVNLMGPQAWAANAQYRPSVVDDTTPQLGGDLDLNGKNLDFPTTANISDVKDEDNMASDSATMLATQQSIKAYMDASGGSPFVSYGVASSTAANASSYAYQCDGTDDQEQILAARVAASANGGGVVQLSEGIFNIDEDEASPTNSIILWAANVSLLGSESGVTTIKVIDNAGRYKGILGDFTAGDLSNVAVRRITFDHNTANNRPADLAGLQTYFRHTFSAYNGTNIEFSDNVVINEISINTVVMNGSAVGATRVSDGRITNNKFLSIGVDTSDFSNDHSTIYSICDRILIDSNIFRSSSWETKAAIETHARENTVTNNIIFGYEIGIHITGINQNDDSVSQIISDNTITSASRGLYIWSQTLGAHTTGYGLNGVLISNNNIKILQDTNYTGSLLIIGIAVNPGNDLPIKNLLIEGNLIEFEQEDASPGYTPTNITSGISLYGNDVDYFVENSSIRNNTIINAPTNGIRVSGTLFKNVEVVGNTIINAGQSKAAYAASRMRGMYIAPSDVEGILLVRDNYILDEFDVTRMIAAFWLDNTNNGDSIELINNTIRVTGSNQAAYVEPYDIADNNVEPLILNDNVETFTNQPGESVRLGSRIIDSAVGSIYSLSATGTSWTSSYYGLDYTNASGTHVIETNDSGTTFGAGTSALKLINTNAAGGGRVTEIHFGPRVSTKKPFAAISGFLRSDSSEEQSGDLIFSTKATAVDAYPDERMRITFTGEVGISDVDPLALLDVGGGTRNLIDGTDDILVKDDIEVDGDAYIGSKIEIGTTTQDGSIVLHDDDVGGDATITVQAPDALGVSWVETKPGNDGDDGQYLRTNGNGVESWDSIEARSLSVTGDWTFAPSGAGGLTDYDISIGDTDGSPTYGVVRIGNSTISRTSYSDGIDLGGAMLINNQGDLDVGNDPGIEFALVEDVSNTIRLAIPESGVGNATAMIRSVTIAGPSTMNNNIVTGDTWTTYDSNLDFDTVSTGADLFVQDDFEAEGDIFSHGTIYLDADDANQLAISATSQTAPHGFDFPDDEIADLDFIKGDGAGSFIYAPIDLSDIPGGTAGADTFVFDAAIVTVADPANPTEAVNLRTLLDVVGVTLNYWISNTTLTTTLTDSEAFIAETPNAEPDELTLIFFKSTVIETPTPFTIKEGAIIEIHFDADETGAAGRDVGLYFQLGYVDADGTSNFVQIGANSDTTAALTVSQTGYENHIHVAADTTVPLGKRLWLKVFSITVSGAGGYPEVNFYYDDPGHHLVFGVSGDIIGNFVRRDGTTPMTANWDAGNFDITLKALTGDGTIEGATLTESSNAVPNATDKLSFFSATTSAELAGVISDETGSGLLVYNDTPTLATPTISGAITFPDNVRQTFNPGANAAGLNAGSQAGDPDTLSNGDIWYDSTANELQARVNGSTVTLGTGGASGIDEHIAGASWDGGGSAISSPNIIYKRVDFDCTITGVEIKATTSGSATIDVWADSYANYPPTDADTITGGNEPATSAGVKDQDETLTSWTTSLTKGDEVGFNVDSVSGHTWMSIELYGTRD